MKHHCDWVVVRCMDFRLNGPLSAHLEARGIREFDLLSWPGGVKDLLHVGSCLMDAIEKVSVNLHGVRKALLVQHTDCGAYGGRAAIVGRSCGGGKAEIDRQVQTSHLQQALRGLMSRGILAEVRGVLAHIDDAGMVTFTEVSV